jgi:hypothetical protein
MLFEVKSGMKKVNDEIIFSVNFKKKTNWPKTIYFIIWTIGVVAMMATIIWGIIETPSRLLTFLFPLIVMFSLVLWVTNIILWNLKGIETILISDKIEISKTGKLFSSKNTIHFYEYDGIYSKDDDPTPFWQTKYRLDGGRIIIKYLGKEIRVGQDINMNKASKVVDEFNDVIEKIKLKN